MSPLACGLLRGSGDAGRRMHGRAHEGLPVPCGFVTRELISCLHWNLHSCLFPFILPQFKYASKYFPKKILLNYDESFFDIRYKMSVDALVRGLLRGSGDAGRWMHARAQEGLPVPCGFVSFLQLTPWDGSGGTVIKGDELKLFRAWSALEKGDKLQVWAFRCGGGELCFAIGRP
ncbi:hypothetical protein ZIOFF_039125 [Zingiber officinale]|uniref:Uncharacterized protein n=1 Tax=Zingiber officinale TaxID=94328 RepID=A0A8J5KWY7_ZINOF|nr:hypothetical protein ZIOFF_039125 [Zingiber officinale]